ncbi:MAG: sodium:dicarboxylate symporter [Bacteroidetes bacterium GWB2_41_8]|nr:MAG: sodium:dicarboxylate symporter [Bacteroidetes bacterium GWB2_41_8]
MKTKQLISFIIAPSISLAIILFGDLKHGEPAVTNTLAVALLMAVWWITEAVPLAVTSLLPVALFPLLGIMDAKNVSSTYFNNVIFLFMGGFVIALAMQRWDLHRRIALKILLTTGVSPGRILLGFMLATAFLSMWMSNTATAMMMMPILISVIDKLEESIGKQEIKGYSVGLLLGVAYSASIGGIATLVGTPPNLSFARIFEIYFPDAPEITFATWLLFALPVSIMLFISAWIYLYYVYNQKKQNWTSVSKHTFRDQLHEMGPMRYEEKVVLIAFISVALLWIFRLDLDLGWIKIPGWSGIFPKSSFLDDGTVAIFVAIVLFIIPSKSADFKRIMDWEGATKIPWHIILLFGGGFALASGIKESGLSTWFGEQLIFVADFNPIVVILSVALLITFLTELTSNTATTEMILPILAGIAISTEINPLFLMLPATLSASLAFMLPVATPPNAIIFGTNRVTVSQMAKTGLILNLIGAVIVTVMTYLLGTFVFDINIGEFPDWAIPK